MTPELQWGLLVCGRSGQISVDVDQAYGAEELLALEISTPAWSLRFRIPEPGIIQALTLFLREDGKDSILVGTFDSGPVELRRDREYADRFFLVVAGGGEARIEFIIAGQQQISELLSALSQAGEDLK